eukprot:6522947-Ditylum_brightwellii.AAC.1
MLLSGVFLQNQSYSRFNLPDEWGELIRASGLSVILLLSGFELNLTDIRKAGAVALRLTFIPGALEALVCGFSSSIIFGMPLSLGLCLGFILAAVSPAVVVTGMLNLQKRGYGTEKGIPSLIVAAASFDDVIAIS